MDKCHKCKDYCTNVANYHSKLINTIVIIYFTNNAEKVTRSLVKIWTPDMLHHILSMGFMYTYVIMYRMLKCRNDDNYVIFMHIYGKELLIIHCFSLVSFLSSKLLQNNIHVTCIITDYEKIIWEYMLVIISDRGMIIMWYSCTYMGKNYLIIHCFSFVSYFSQNYCRITYMLHVSLIMRR
jgi:hypothetical protein